MGDAGVELDGPTSAPLGDLVKGRLRVTQAQLTVLVQTEREQFAVLCPVNTDEHSSAHQHQLIGHRRTLVSGTCCQSARGGGGEDGAGGLESLALIVGQGCELSRSPSQRWMIYEGYFLGGYARVIRVRFREILSKIYVCTYFQIYVSTYHFLRDTVSKTGEKCLETKGLLTTND